MCERALIWGGMLVSFEMATEHLVETRIDLTQPVIGLLKGTLTIHMSPSA